jgi:nitric oxide reductase NorD protein
VLEGGSLNASARVLAFYLKAGWNVTARVEALAVAREDGDLRADRPVLTEPVIFLPDANADHDPRLLHLASVAHAAAHLAWSSARYEVGKLRPLQRELVGVMEDARVERLAMLRYPGLRRWWLPFHRTDATSAKTAPALIARLSRGLLDPAYMDEDGWVKKGRALFDAAFDRTRGLDPALSRELGNLLGNDLGQMRVQFNAKTYAQEPAYRDDNSLLWNVEPTPIAPSPDDEPAERNATMQESPRLRELPETHDEPLEVADTPGETHAASSATHDDETPFTIVSIARYREWDYVIRRYRSNWCTVESLAVQDVGNRIVAQEDKDAQAAVRAILRTARQRVIAGRTRAFEGDVLDLDACIAGRIDARRGEPDDIKGFVTRRMRSQGGPLAVLLDLSASSAAGGRIGTALASACTLGRALAASGRHHAIYGFHSDGRQRVRFHVFKDFDDAWTPAIEARLTHIRPELSTRFGAALRHVGSLLAERMNESRAASVLVVSDGVPYDIDSFDPRYLREDMRRAIGELARQGIRCGCLSLDPGSLDQAIAMFGRERVAPLASPQGLAQALRRLASITG